jgi:hypothetical protein
MAIGGRDLEARQSEDAACQADIVVTAFRAALLAAGSQLPNQRDLLARALLEALRGGT